MFIERVTQDIAITGGAVRLEDRWTLVVFRAWRDCPDGYRVDRKDMFAWEAIDGGKPCVDLDAAIAFIERWIRAACEQHTLTPRVTP